MTMPTLVIPAKAGIPLLLRVFAPSREFHFFLFTRSREGAKEVRKNSGIPAFAGLTEKEVGR